MKASLLRSIFIFCALFSFGNLVAQTQIIWTDTMTNNVAVNSSQNATWTSFCTALVPHSYTKVIIKGTYDQVGQSCTDPIVATALANSLHTNTDYISPLTCGHVWHNCATHGYFGEVWLDPPNSCDGSNCPGPNGYIIRPNLSVSNPGNPNWGGVNTNTCSGPTQRQTMIFEYSDVTSVLGTNVAEAEFSVYPNPFGNSFNVSVKNINTVELTVSNLIGEVVYKQQITVGTSTINTEKLVPGIYFVSVKTENGVLTKKIIKE